MINPADTPDILKKIINRKEQEIDTRVRQTGIEEIIKRAKQANPVRGFVDSIKQRIAAGDPAIIAEIKKASPSKGLIREDFNPADIAKRYQEGGASCVSVLTDIDFFKGSDDYLKQARAACELPVIRKDFIIDPYQVYESRAMGADCILLIVAVLDNRKLNQLYTLAKALNMDVLIEIHDQDELQRALPLGAELLGINNRNLRNFETSLQTSLDLLEQIPDDRIVVTESGIHTVEDVKLMRDNNINAFLVGEAFMRAKDPGAELHKLFFEH